MITSADSAKQAYEAFNNQAEFYSDNIRAGDIFTAGDSYYNRQQDLASQRAANAYNSWQAQLQRDFEERMDNTKYQRAAKDIQAAGFSPLALLSNSPSSAPSGVSASYSAGAKTRSKEKSGLMDLASLAIRVLGLLALAG